MDFTLKKYCELLKTLGAGDYRLRSNISSGSIIRHDVDRSLVNSLIMAKLENSLNMKSTYYFRFPKTFDVNIIDKISNLGHEIGYHYEVLDKTKGDYRKAIELFKEELLHFKRWNIKTICMHGNPLTEWDNINLWKEHDFARFGLKAEAYLSVDFNKTSYFTDTGRKWNSLKFAVKDRIESKIIKIKNTDDLISKIKRNELSRVYISTHPCRWNDNLFIWTKELVWQNIKNTGKMLLYHECVHDQ